MAKLKARGFVMTQSIGKNILGRYLAYLSEARTQWVLRKEEKLNLRILKVFSVSTREVSVRGGFYIDKNMFFEM